MKSKAKITAVFEFTEAGFLKRVFLNARTDEDAAVLERAIARLIDPSHFGWLRRLIRKK